MNTLHRSCHLFRFCLVFTVVFATGCFRSTGELKKYTLSGQVIFKGTPVPSGTIRFTPDTDAGNKGPETVVHIKDGHYETHDGYGILGGPYRIRIIGYKQVKPSDADSGPGGYPPEPLFPDYTMTYDFDPADSTVDFEVREQ